VSKFIRKNSSKDNNSINLKNYPVIEKLSESPQSDLNQNDADDDLINRIKDKGIYIFGAHKVGLNLKNLCESKEIRVLGFFDNDELKNNSTLNNVLISMPNQKNTSGKLIVVASGRYSNLIIEQLNLYDCFYLNIHKFQYLFQLRHQAESNFRNFRTTLYTNYCKVWSAFSSLNDEKSRKTFEGLIKLRTTLEVSHLDQFKCDFNDEYIDHEFINIEDMRSFVDVGAYNGDTLDRIEKRFGFSNKSYLFEPELTPYIQSLIKYKHRENVYIFNLGLSDKLFKLNYQGEFTYDLKTTESTNLQTQTIQFIKLDSLGIDDVSFIKIDVEGGELSVLKGASELIQKFKPKLAVCAYHRANDYWEIINYITNLYPNYKVGMRHYSDILDDTTLYFY
jgi:FkbM family methyltransferase